jgi:hypothetical protein
MKKSGRNLIYMFLMWGLIMVNLIGCSKSESGSGGADQPVPILITQAVTGITATTASSGGVITSDDGNDITARGVCWNTSQSPTTSNAKTTDGTGTGSYFSSVTGLTPGTTYYLRAYAVNKYGTGYGNTLPFTTEP